MAADVRDGMLSSVRRVIHFGSFHPFKIQKFVFSIRFRNQSHIKMSQTTYEKICKLNYTLDLTDPLKSYLALIEKTIKSDLMDDGTGEETDEMWDMVCESVRETLWKLLFDSKNPTQDQYEKAGALLKEHKIDAAFVNPTAYNTWIYKLRDELLKREMFDFWRDVIVANELGIAWARDSDMFDNYEDPEPVNFYKFAGCEAAWLKEEKNKPSAPPLNLMNVGADKSPEAPKTLKKITKENAEEDYKNNMIAQGDIGPDDEEAYKKIFAEVREMVWQILFSEPTLSEVNSKKAADLLFQYKLDACFFSPYAYNDWITTVRDELFKRKYFDFWKIICDKKMGLCWYKDSDYFDDEEDTKPLEFYKSGDLLMKQHEKK